MTLISLSQDIPLAHYNFFLFCASISSIVMFVTLLLNKEYSLKGSVIGTIVCFVFFYYWAYSAADKYYALEKKGDYLKLSYISPAKNKSISINNIEYISFGSTNRRGRGCYISITLFSGDKYKSSAIQEKINYCTEKRNELALFLNIKANKALKSDS